MLAARLGLCGADSVYVAVADRLNLPLFTFDVDQRDRAKEHVAILTMGNG
jgi:predicted nucleic acid-binding protein